MPGVAEPFFLVNTEANLLFKALALSRLSVAVVSLTDNDETPTLSLRHSLMKDQSFLLLVLGSNIVYAVYLAVILI